MNLFTADYGPFLSQHVKPILAVVLSDYGPFLRQHVKPVLAVVLSVLIVFGCAFYCSGYLLGSAIHGTNNGLAWLVTGYSPTVGPRAATVAPRVATVAPRVATENLKVADLRILARQAGYKKLARSGRRAELVAVLSGEARS